MDKEAENNKIANIDYLMKLQAKNWFELFDYIFENNSLPRPFRNDTMYPISAFDLINNKILLSNNSHLLNSYHNNLIEYYKAIPNTIVQYDKIYQLQELFAEIKIRNNKYLFSQFLENQLLNKYYGKINLHTSLLSTLIILPNIEKYDLSTHIINSIDKINNLAFYRVSLRYFIKHKSIAEYIEYFIDVFNRFNKFILSNLYDKNRLALLLVESLMDLMDFYGSFEKLYTHINYNKFWENIYSRNEELTQKITYIFNDKYLKEGKKWFDNDIYAQSFKLYINSIELPPAPSLLQEIYNKINDYDFDVFKIENLFSKILNLSRNWESYQLEISDNEIFISPKDKISKNGFFKIREPLKIEANVLTHYKRSYGINTRKELFITTSENEFPSIITASFPDDVSKMEPPVKKAIMNNLKEEKNEEYAY